MRAVDAKVGRMVTYQRGGTTHTGTLAHVAGVYAWVSLPAPQYQARVPLAKLAKVVRGGRRHG